MADPINFDDKSARAFAEAIKEINSDTDDLYSQLRGIVGELGKASDPVNLVAKELKGIYDISKKLKYTEDDISRLNKKQLEDLQKKIKERSNELKLSIQSVENTDKFKKISKEIQELVNESGISASSWLKTGQTQFELTNKELEIYDLILQNKQDLQEIEDKTLGIIKNRIAEEEKITSNSGVKGFGFLKDLSKSIPGLRILSEPFDKASEAAENIARDGGNGLAAFKAGGAELLSSFKGAALWSIIIKQLWDAFIKTDKLAGDMAKSMNMTYSASLSTVTSLTSMANVSNDNFVTTQKLGESLMFINKTLGTSVELSAQQLVIFTQLREKAGLTNEELMGMSALSLATNQDFKSLTEQFLGQAQITASNNKVLLNSKDLFRSIKDISAATTLSLGQNSGKLAEALATTKAMGIEMSKIEGIQNTLMDFESSIENQLAAELLTGRQINLERARGYALNNDIKGLTEEIAKNVGTAADFGKMNLIQQNNLAQAVGMSREELAKSLYIREQLLNVSAKDQALAERVINAKIKEVGLDQAQKELGEQSLQDMMKQTSMQDRFNASVEKMKELFVGVVEAIMPLVDILMTVVDLAGILMKIIDPFIQALGALGGMVKDFLSPNDPIANHYYNEGLNKMGSSIENNWLNPLGFAGDIISPASGRTTISTKEGGLLKLSPNDDVIAAPGAAKLLNKQSSYNVDMSETNNLLKQLVYKQGTIKIDNTEIGTAFAVNSYNIQ